MEPRGRKRILIMREKKDKGVFLERPDIRTCMVSHIPPKCKLAGLTGMGKSLSPKLQESIKEVN